MSNDYIKIQNGSYPRIISEFACEVNNGLNCSIKEHCDEGWKTCGIRCNCGNLNLTVNSDELKDNEYLGSSILIGCNDCNKEFEIFNMYTQGYDGELGNNGDTASDDLAYDILKCKSCGSDIFEIALGFEYAIYKDEASDFEKELKDLFTRLVGSVKCKNCGCISQVIDYECA